MVPSGPPSCSLSLYAIRGCPLCPQWNLGQLKRTLARICSQLPVTALATRLSTSPGNVEMFWCDNPAKLSGPRCFGLSFSVPCVWFPWLQGLQPSLVTKQREESKSCWALPPGLRGGLQEAAELGNCHIK